MNPPPRIEHLELLLDSDRQAILGRLSAGLTHVMNNVLGGVIGQVDLLSMTNGGTHLQKDLEQIITICDEGVMFTKNISKIISAFHERNLIDINELLNSLVLLISRVYRRTGLRAVVRSSGVATPVVNGELFIQAAFHLLLIAFEGELSNREPGNKPPVEVELRFDRSSINLLINHIKSMSVPLTLPVHGEGIDYHSWVVHQVVQISGATINYQQEYQTCTMVWPTPECGTK